VKSWPEKMSKVALKKFGDKLDLNVSGELTLAERIHKARTRTQTGRDDAGGASLP
jgi:hypothetical protein